MASGNEAGREPRADSETESLPNALMGLVAGVLDQIPDHSAIPNASPWYTPSSPAAVEAQLQGKDVVEDAIRQGWSAILAMGEMHYALGYLLLVDESLNLSPWVLVRSHLELAARAAWIFDPLVTGVVRVERSIAMQLDEINRSHEFVKESSASFGPKYGLDGDDARSGLEKMWGEIESQSQKLGIEIRPAGDGIRRIRKVGSTRLLGPGAMAGKALGQKVDYEFLSAMVHHRPMTVFSLSNIRGTLLEFTEKMLHWFALPSWYFFILCGFDLVGLSKVFDEAWDRAQLPQDDRFWTQFDV